MFQIRIQTMFQSGFWELTFKAQYSSSYSANLEYSMITEPFIIPNNDLILSIIMVIIMIVRIIVNAAITLLQSGPKR